MTKIYKIKELINFIINSFASEKLDDFFWLFIIFLFRLIWAIVLGHHPALLEILQLNKLIYAHKVIHLFSVLSVLGTILKHFVTLFHGGRGASELELLFTFQIILLSK